MTRMLSGVLVILVTALMAACGGGGDAAPAPSGLTYGTVPAFTIHTAITPLAPTVAGQVTAYSITPALPAGLGINATTGVISGTPTALAAQATYTVAAKNSSGSATTSVSIVVNDVAPTAAYSSPTYSFSANVKAQAIKPTTGGGAVVTWSVTPALPAGLTLDTSTGTISGTPTTVTAAGTYVVTATNSGGNSAINLTTAVAGAPLMDLGHTGGVLEIRYTGTDVLSLDYTGHWVLQNYASGATIASGDDACYETTICEADSGSLPGAAIKIGVPVDIAGTTVIDGIPGGIEVRSATTGQVIGMIGGQYSWYQLASDGSYVVTADTTALAAYTPTGERLFSLAGDFSQSVAFSTPTAVEVAMGPAGQNVIETVTAATGATAVSAPFQGQFSAWFVDGSRFLTTLGTTVWTYSAAAVQQDISQVPTSSGQPGNLGGVGNYFWTGAGISGGNQVNVYQVGNSGSPALTATAPTNTFWLVQPSGTTLGLLEEGNAQLQVIDLSGATPTLSSIYSVPTSNLSAYAATSAANWIVGNNYGVMLDGASLAGTPRFLTQGEAWSIAGGTSYFSVATAAGFIFNFAADTDALISTISDPSTQLSSSSSGAILASLPDFTNAQYVTSANLNIYSLPSGAVINSIAYPNQQSPTNLSLSASGTNLAESFYLHQTQPCPNQVIPVAGGSTIWCDSTGAFQRVTLSPDGTLIAASTAGGTDALEVGLNSLIGSTDSTSIYKNGTLVTSLPGVGIGWISDGQLLVNNYTGGAESVGYGGSTIYSASGVSIGAPSLPELSTFDVAGPNLLYVPSAGFITPGPFNVIVSLTTGAVTWASGDVSNGTSAVAGAPIGVGAISGSQVVFVSGVYVLAQPQ